MPKAAFVFALCLACGFTFAQPPSDPALLIPQAAPELDYVAVPNTFDLPAGIKMGAPASVAFDSRKHLFVLNRGPQPLMEFDEDQKFIRAFGEPSDAHMVFAWITMGISGLPTSARTSWRSSTPRARSF
jgi:hypothetical protein